MGEQTEKITKASTPEMVDAFMQNLDYPLHDLVQHLRELILSFDAAIGEEIYWNAPCFFYTGPLHPFAPKDYKRYIVGFNLYKKDSVRLIFLRGTSVENANNLLEGDYKDGRRLATFRSIAEVNAKQTDLKNIIKQLLAMIDKD